MNPSLATVKRTCSEPGVMVNFDLVTNPFETACAAIDADLQHLDRADHDADGEYAYYDADAYDDSYYS